MMNETMTEGRLTKYPQTKKDQLKGDGRFLQALDSQLTISVDRRLRANSSTTQDIVNKIRHKTK